VYKLFRGNSRELNNFIPVSNLFLFEKYEAELSLSIQFGKSWAILFNSSFDSILLSSIAFSILDLIHIGKPLIRVIAVSLALSIFFLDFFEMCM